MLIRGVFGISDYAFGVKQSSALHRAFAKEYGWTMSQCDCGRLRRGAPEANYARELWARSWFLHFAAFRPGSMIPAGEGIFVFGSCDPVRLQSLKTHSSSVGGGLQRDGFRMPSALKPRKRSNQHQPRTGKATASCSSIRSLQARKSRKSRFY